MSRFVACSFGGLLAALVVGAVFALFLRDTSLNQIVAGCFATLLAWIVGIMRGLFAASPKEVWLDHIKITFVGLALLGWLW